MSPREPMRVLEVMGENAAEKWRQAALWLDGYTHLLQTYQLLPEDQRAALVACAAKQAISLPLEAANQPEEAITGLTALGVLDRDALVEVYRGLTAREGQQLARDTFGLRGGDPYDEEWGAVDEALLFLAYLVPGSLHGTYMELIRQLISDPPELYWSVDSEARNEMIRLVETDAEKRYFVLRLLAWTRDGVVEAALRRWRQAPPDSDMSFGSQIDEAVLEAGWELTEAAGPRFLYPSECYRLDREEATFASDLPGPVDVITPHEETCRWCGQQLVNLFDLDLQDPRVTFVAPGWKRLRVAMCGRCTRFGTLYSDVDMNGGSRWSELNQHPGFIGEDDQGYIFPQRCLVLGPRRRTPLEARVDRNRRSQIGGFPEWEQGNSHPECPKCNRLMPFVGQLATEEAFGEPAEGVTYAFLCQECQIAATTYEQT